MLPSSQAGFLGITRFAGTSGKRGEVRRCGCGRWQFKSSSGTELILGDIAFDRAPDDTGAMAYPDLAHPTVGEPEFSDPAQLRAHRKRRLALGYRIFGAMRYGSLGDGHISARDPERTDHFWLARYGVPFGQVTVDDLVLVAPRRVGRRGPRLDQPGRLSTSTRRSTRPGRTSSAPRTPTRRTARRSRRRRELLEPISQESCTFFEDHALFDDEEVDIASTDGGKRIAAALGSTKAVILRNHGPLTVGATVDSAVGFFVQLERAAEVHVKVADAKPISAEAARAAYRLVGSEQTGRQLFEWLLRTHVPDPSRRRLNRVDWSTFWLYRLVVQGGRVPGNELGLANGEQVVERVAVPGLTGGRDLAVNALGAKGCSQPCRQGFGAQRRAVDQEHAEPVRTEVPDGVATGLHPGYRADRERVCRGDPDDRHDRQRGDHLGGGDDPGFLQPSAAAERRRPHRAAGSG